MTARIERKSHTSRAGITLTYSIWNPQTGEGQFRPIVLALHPGWAGAVPEIHYGELFLESLFAPALGSSGALIAAPDCPCPAWNHPAARDALVELVAELQTSQGCGECPVSVVGYSAGGWGGWYLLMQDEPKISSAIMLATLPIIDPVESFSDNFRQVEEVAGARRMEWLDRVPDIPIFIIHSCDDELLPFAIAEQAYRGLVECRKDVHMLEISGIGHFDSTGYVQGLRETVPWLRDSWRPGGTR
jgi:predicted esterase